MFLHFMVYIAFQFIAKLWQFDLGVSGDTALEKGPQMAKLKPKLRFESDICFFQDSKLFKNLLFK